MKRPVIKNGFMLMQRLGTIEFSKQDRWSRAPKKRGMWAFPYPYWEAFFTHHKYVDLLPKHLQDIVWDEENTLWDDEAFAKMRDKHDELWEQREKWLKEVGRKILPIRKFWYQGYVYCHLDKRGEILEEDDLPLDTWEHIHTSDLMKRIKKSGGDRDYEFVDGRREEWKTSADHLEVFIAQSDGKIRDKI